MPAEIAGAGGRGVVDRGEPATGPLIDLGGGSTEIVIHQRHVPESMRSPEARAGFLTSLDKLEEHLTRLMREERP